MMYQATSLFLGIDIGGSSIKYGWGNSKQGLQLFDQIQLNDKTLKSFRKSINQVFTRVQTELGYNSIKAVGLGTPGTFDFIREKLVGVNPNLPELTNLSPRSFVPKELKQRTYIDNDANLMTLAEAYQYPDRYHVIGITIGSGIGCGYVVNKQIYRGAHGYAMELGHNIMIENGMKCNCGKSGCLEAYTSVNGIINQYKKLHSKSDIKNMADILEHAKHNKQLQLILDKSMIVMATAISNLIINLDADLLVLGGGVIELADYPYDTLKKLTISKLPEIMKKAVTINKAKFGNRAGVIGAICLAESRY